MKILLVYPSFLEARIHEEEIAAPPMGLYYIGALLKEHGLDAEILNLHHLKDDPGQVEALLAARKPDVIGFSILHANRWGALDIAKTAKRLLPEVTIVLGGVGATFLWEHLLARFPQIDYCVLGEGETTFLQLVTCLATKDAAGIESLPGIALRRGGKVASNGPAAPVADLDTLPNPARHFTFQHVALSRGCPGACTFCGSPRFWGTRVRFHSAGYFVDQLELLYRKGVSFFYVSDDTFTFQKARVLAVCREILARKLPISWAAISRVNFVDEEILSHMRRAGCVQISYGVESGSPAIRRVFNKRFSTGQIRKAFDLTRSFGILPRAYFIYGAPGESRETIQETLDLIDRIEPLGAIFYILDLFPGTALYDDFRKRCHTADDIWLERIEDILYFETDPGLSREMVLEFGRTLRSHFHARLPDFARNIRLVEAKDFYPLHADFLSRLGMTFSHGDYAAVDQIPNKDETAAALFEKALGYHPDHRAYLGLGMLKQKARDFAASVRVLEQGLGHFPRSEALSVCAGLSLMNLGRFQEAAAHFARHTDSPQAAGYLDHCRRQLARRP